MVCEMAMEDIAGLERQGIRLTPAEIVRLNCLGLRVSRSPEAADTFAAPRVAWAGAVAVHEPTLQAEEWMRVYASRFAADDASYWSMCLFACVHATRAGFFARPEMQTADGIQREIDAWRAACPATQEQLSAAFASAYYGTDPAADAVAEPKPGAPDQPERAPAHLEAMADVLAAGLGLAPDEMQTLTASTLYAVLSRWCANQGCAGAKLSNARQHADYVRTLHAIRKAHAGEAAHE